MSQFFKSPEAVLYSEVFIAETIGYTVQRFATDKLTTITNLESDTAYVTDGGEELVRKIMQVSNHRLRMYGSARELAENVKICLNATEASIYSDGHALTFYPYYTVPKVHKSVKGEEYICKQDAYLILQNMTLEAYPFKKPRALRELIAVFLRSQELANFEVMEFARFDENVFEEINEEIKEQTKHFMNDFSNFHRLKVELADAEWPRVCEMFRNLIPMEWSNLNASLLECVLNGYVEETYSSTDPSNFLDRFTVVYGTFRDIAKILKKVMDERAEIFKSEGSNITVRLFEDGEERFVMRAELMEAIGRSKKTKMNYKDEGIIIDTMSMEDVGKNYGDQIQSIEFIRNPILRAKHRAVEIPIGPGHFCRLATDTLFEFLRDLIFWYRAFQKQQTVFFTAFKGFDMFFNPEAKENVLFNTRVAGVLYQAAKISLQNVEGIAVKDVRDVKKEGFTVQNLKNELAHLNLTKAFPEIQNHAEVVYAEVDKRKKEKVLRTCDLFDAIEHCQLICIFERLPKLKKFLHNQKSCRRVMGMKCSTCPPFYQNDPTKSTQKVSESEPPGQKTLCADSNAKKASDPESSNSQTSQVIPDVKKSPEPTKPSPQPQTQATESSEVPKDSENPPESLSSESQNSRMRSTTLAPESRKSSESSNQKMSVENPTKKKLAPESQTPESKAPETQNQKTSESKISKPKALKRVPEDQKPPESHIAEQKTGASNSEKATESPNQKTSANCEKCFRTCEMLNETKKELKSSENKLKNFWKKLSGKEKEVEELKKNQKEEMDEKEKEIQEKEEENQNLKDQISNLKSSMVQVEEENLRQKEKLESGQKLLDEQVSRLEKEIQGSERRVQEKEEENRNFIEKISGFEYYTARVEEEKLRQMEQFKSTQDLLEEKVLRLEQELLEEKMKSQKMSDEKKEILEKNRRIKELEGSERRVQEKEEENRNLANQISNLISSMSQMEVEWLRNEEKLMNIQKHLEKRVFRLEQELREGNENMWDLQNRMSSGETLFKSEIQKKNQKIEMMKEREIRIKAENEVNQRMIQQLMDKLASSGVSSGFRTNSEVSTTTPRIQKCEICWNETNDREAVRCQKCRKPFHHECASQWLKMYQNCPSCEEEFLGSTNTHFSAFS